MNDLVEIQAELRVPKGQRNEFGNYNYRSAEDITEAAKPIIHRHGCYLLMTDAIEEHGGRLFLRAEATLTNGTGEKVSCSGLAEIAAQKKGMDPAQITGAASSYARKYALGGLFALDDNRDPDMMPPPEQEPRKAEQPAMTAEEKQLAFMQKLGVSKADAETAIGKDFKDFSADDNRFLREAFKLMMQGKIGFEEAVTRQAEIEQGAGK